MDASSEEFETISDRAMIHPLSHVEDSVLSDHCTVWQFASIIRGATIGECTNIGHGAIVDGCPVGRECTIGSNAAINPGTMVGDYVFIGPGVVTCNDYAPDEDCEGFDMKSLFDGRWTVIIENNASIGANATILPGVRIGGGALVAAGAVVDRDVPPMALYRRDGTIKENYKRPPRMRYAR